MIRVAARATGLLPLRRARRFPRCPACGTSILPDDESVLYRGQAFHADPCARRRPRAPKRRGGVQFYRSS